MAPPTGNNDYILCPSIFHKHLNKSLQLSYHLGTLPGLHSTGGKTEAQSYKYICQTYQGQEGTGGQRDSDLNTELGPGLSGSKLGQIKISQALSGSGSMTLGQSPVGFPVHLWTDISVWPACSFLRPWLDDFVSLSRGVLIYTTGVRSVAWPS